MKRKNFEMSENDKYKGEKVLVFSREVFEEVFFEDFWWLRGVFLGVRTYLDIIFDDGDCQFINRVQAEVDSQFKQLIPYVVFVCGDRVFSYVRGKTSGEERLVGNRSIGIGGHINSIDRIAYAGDWWSIFLEGTRREVYEEIEFRREYELLPEAIINDTSNDVGQVHFGVLFVVNIENESDIFAKEDCLTDSEFISIVELKGFRREELEGWSKLVIDYL